MNVDYTSAASTIKQLLILHSSSIEHLIYINVSVITVLLNYTSPPLQQQHLEQRINEQFLSRDNLYVHDNLCIKMREFLVKGLEMLIWILHIINTTHFSYAMHWQLRCANINRANTYTACKDRTNGWTTRHVIAHHKVLHQDNMTTFILFQSFSVISDNSKQEISLPLNILQILKMENAFSMIVSSSVDTICSDQREEEKKQVKFSQNWPEQEDYVLMLSPWIWRMWPHWLHSVDLHYV